MEYIGLAVFLGIVLAIFSERKFQTRLRKIENSQKELVSLNHRLDLILQSKTVAVEKTNKNLDHLATLRFVSAAYTRELNYKPIEQDTLSYPSLELKPCSPKKKKHYPATLQYA